MSKSNERGAVQFIVLIILALGLVAGVYLVQNPTFFKPKASELKPSSPETSFTLLQSSSQDMIKVSLYARSDIDAANLFAAKLKFPTDLLEVVKIETNTSSNKTTCPPPPICKNGTLIHGDPDPDNPDQCPKYFCSGGGSTTSFTREWSVNWEELPVGEYSISFEYPHPEVNGKPTKLPSKVDVTVEEQKTTEVKAYVTEAKAVVSEPKKFAETKPGYGMLRVETIDAIAAKITVAPAKKACAQVITRACPPNSTILNPNVERQSCQDFPTPCDVPADWILEKDLVCGKEHVGAACPVGYRCNDSGGRCERDSEITYSTGFIKNWLDQSYDNEKGTISIVGGAPDPGYQTNLNQESLLMATISFRVKKEGMGKIAFTDDSAIYNNTDNIDILTIKRDLELDTTIPKISCTNIGVEGGIPVRNNSGELVYYVVESEAKVNLSAQVNPIDSSITWVEAPRSKNLPEGKFDNPNSLDTVYTVPKNTGKQQEGVTIRADIPNSDKPLASCPSITLAVNPIFPISPTPIPSTTPTPSWNGDINKDGKVNLADASTFFSKCTNKNVFNKPVKIQPSCDVNGDGKVNSFDLGSLISLLIAAGLIKSPTDIVKPL